MSEPETDLLAAVDAITKPVILVRWQETGHDHEWEPVLTGLTPTGEYVCRWCDTITTTPTHSPPEKVVRRRMEEPLLDQLQAAVASSLGGDGFGKSARERVPIDTSALMLYEMIDGRVRSWLDELGARPGKTVTVTQALRTWYVMWSAGHHDDHLEDRYRSVIVSWEQQIMDKLQPPKRIEITAPCTVCGKEWMNVGLKLSNGADDPEDLEMVRVLNAVERSTLEESYAVCRACSTVWLGVGRMRELRASLDDRDATNGAA